MNQILKPKKGYKFEKWLFGKEIIIPEEWEISKFDDVFEFLVSGTNARSDLNDNGEIRYIHYGDIHTKWNAQLDCDLDEIPRIDNEKVSKLQLLKEGDLIIADASEDVEGSGTSISLKNVKNKKIVAGLHTLVLRRKDENIAFGFMKYLTSINYVKIQITSWVTGAKVFGLTKANSKKIKVPLPTLPEQQKIAMILSNVDNLISNTQKIISQNKSLKKGLIQKLLTRGISHNKFKKVEWYFGNQIEIPEEWEITTLEKSCLKKKGSFSMGPFGSDIKTSNFVSEGVPVIRGINLTVPPFYDHEFVFLTEEKADELKNSNVFSEDLIFTHRGTLGQVGIIPINAKYKKYVISQSQMKCTCDKNILLPEFAFIFFSSGEGQKIINLHSTKFGVPHIVEPLTSLRKFLILLPTVDEQQKIVTILSNIELEIKSQIQYKEKLERLKKSLMQNLLTGKIRVKV